MDQCYKIKDLSRMTGIPYITLYRELKDCHLTGFKVRGAWYVSKADWLSYQFIHVFQGLGIDMKEYMRQLKKERDDTMKEIIEAASKSKTLNSDKEESFTDEERENDPLYQCLLKIFEPSIQK